MFRFFDDPARFPAGSAQLDCALLMRDIRHESHGEPQLRGDELMTKSTIRG